MQNDTSKKELWNSVWDAAWERCAHCQNPRKEFYDRITKKKGGEMITISIKRIICGGEKKTVVTSITAKTNDELPVRYTDTPGSVWRDIDILYIRTPGGYPANLLEKGTIYDPGAFRKALKEIIEAGKMLKQINEELAIKNLGWESSLDLVI